MTIYHVRGQDMVRLEEGIKVEETDFYLSTSGQWEPCPCPGGTVNPRVVWVRPVSRVSPKKEAQGLDWKSSL